MFPARMNRESFLALLMFLTVILVYQPIWWAGYVWDDDLVLTANPVVIGPLGLKEIWTTNAADICPLTITTFWLEHALWGLAPLPYHLVNVLLHGASALVLWRVLRALQVPGALLGAALWAFHPVAVESVAWVAELKNTESGLFFLLTILFFVPWLRSGTRWNYIATLIFALLAMCSKSSTVILPGVLCLCAWWMEGRWHWRNLSRVAPIIVMSIIAASLSIWTQRLEQSFADDTQWTRSWPERFAGAGDAVWFYLGKLVWPDPLMAIYPRWPIDSSQWISYLPLLAVVAALVALWLYRETAARSWFFAFAYFLIALLPALGLAENYIFRFSLVFDHFQYLASMGPLALAGAGVARLAEYFATKKSPLPTVLGAGLLLVLGTVSWQRAWVYESSETLWTDTLAKNPNCWLGYQNLGDLYFQKGDLPDAMGCFAKALQINPRNAMAHAGLGNAYITLGHVEQAVAEYQTALSLDPHDAKPHNNLGNVYFQKGQTVQAIDEYKKALAIDPYYLQAHANLGRAFLQNGQVDDAIEECQRTLQMNPDDAAARATLALANAQKGK